MAGRQCFIQDASGRGLWVAQAGLPQEEVEVPGAGVEEEALGER